MLKIDFWRLWEVYLGTKKTNFFRHILHMPTKSMSISLRFFFTSRNLKNLNYRSDFKLTQISEFLSDFAHSGG